MASYLKYGYNQDEHFWLSRDPFQQCITNMYDKIKLNNLTHDFMAIPQDKDFKKKGFLFTDAPIIHKLSVLTDSDGHSGASFSLCCYHVYHKIIKEQRKAKFKGIVRAIIQFKRLRRKTLERFYSLEGQGFLNAQAEFYSISNHLISKK